MKVTFGEVLGSTDVLHKIFEAQVDNVVVAYKAGKVDKEIGAIRAEWSNILRDLVMKHGEEVEDGNFRYPQEGTEEFKEFTEELDEALLIECDLDVDFSIELLEEIQQKSEGLTLSANETGRLEWLLG